MMEMGGGSLVENFFLTPQLALVDISRGGSLSLPSHFRVGAASYSIPFKEKYPSPSNLNYKSS